MSLAAHLYDGRSDRVAVDRVGTLRDSEWAPADVVVENLSTTGCLFMLDRELPLGAVVSIGIPGLGMRYARITRADQPQYGCGFLAPVGAGDVAAALSADTVVAGVFRQMPAPGGQTGEEVHPGRKLSLGTRVALIGGTSALLWTAIVAGVMAVAR